MPLLPIDVSWNAISAKRGTPIGASWNSYRLYVPYAHWRRIRTNNAIERLNKEVRRRTKVVGAFPDGKSALMLVTARLKYVAGNEWGSKRFLSVSLLDE